MVMLFVFFTERRKKTRSTKQNAQLMPDVAQAIQVGNGKGKMNTFNENGNRKTMATEGNVYWYGLKQAKQQEQQQKLS